MDNEQNNSNAAEVENFPLDEAVIGYLADIKTARAQLQATWEKLQAEEQGALQLFSRQHKLVGAWKVADNGRELVKQPDPAPAQKEG